MPQESIRRNFNTDDRSAIYFVALKRVNYALLHSIYIVFDVTLVFVQVVFFIMSVKYLKHFKAVFLVNHANGPKLLYARAAKVLRKSKAFVQKWVKRFTEVGNVDDLLGRGTKSFLNRGGICQFRFLQTAFYCVQPNMQALFTEQSLALTQC